MHIIIMDIINVVINIIVIILATFTLSFAIAYMSVLHRMSKLTQEFSKLFTP